MAVPIHICTVPIHRNLLFLKVPESKRSYYSHIYLVVVVLSNPVRIGISLHTLNLIYPVVQVLPGLHTLSRARVTQLLNPLKLPEELIEEIEGMGDYWENTGAGKVFEDKK